MKFYTTFLNRFKRKPEFKGFSDFLLKASEEEKIRVFREAAHQANEDQRALFYKSNVLSKN